ncbi:MAG: LacI family DNA-binding transcriptional regulator [Kineosporiaceae bacterium]|nr:LacI family DNA-binding transcriptional regulator [Kineosporiaceae bacterium]
MAARPSARGAATRADVARRAGVSASTVTYVLTGERPISAETRERVQAAMAELGYQPNALASGLAGRRSRILALLLPSGGREVDNADLEYVVAAADEARGLGYHLMLWTTDGDDIQEAVRLARTGLVDGLLLMEVTLHDERVRLLSDTGVPVALIGRTADPVAVPYADADAEQMGAMAVDHLADLGHRRLAYLDEPEAAGRRGLGYSSRLTDAVRKRCAERGLSLTVAATEHSQAAGREAFTRVYRGRHKITGVISANWRAVLGLVHEVTDHGLTIPGDLSVVSITSWDQHAQLTTPELTTISQPARDIGRAAALGLIRRLEGDGAPEHHLFPGRIDLRGSTAPPPS